MRTFFRAFTLFALITLPASIAFSVRYNAATAYTETLIDPNTHPSDWVGCAFSLSDIESTAVKEAQDKYTSECAKLCKSYIDAREHLRFLADDLTTPDEKIEEALSHLASCYQHCQAHGLAHVREIALELPEEHKRNYLSIMIPEILSDQYDSQLMTHQIRKSKF